MTSQQKTGIHPFLWQASIRPVLIHFYDKPAEDQYSSIFMTSWHKTSAHPFYIGMYIHIYTHIYVYINILLRRNVYIFFMCIYIYSLNNISCHCWHRLVNWEILPCLQEIHHSTSQPIHNSNFFTSRSIWSSKTIWVCGANHNQLVVSTHLKNMPVKLDDLPNFQAENEKKIETTT